MKNEERHIYKIAVCKDTGLEVIQTDIEGYGEREWLCLHNDDEKKDAECVRLFKMAVS